MKDTYTREEIIQMLQEMQQEAYDCIGFIKGMVSQLWVVRDLLGEKITELGGESIDYRID